MFRMQYCSSSVTFWIPDSSSANLQISPAEAAYLACRQPVMNEALSKFLKRHHLDPEVNITISVALSGGGYRSMLFGLGFLNSMDSGLGAKSALGGLFQATSYVAGISGGSWAVMNTAVSTKSVAENIAYIAHSINTPLLEGIPDIDLSQIRSNLDTAPEKNSSVSSVAAALLGLVFSTLQKSTSSLHAHKAVTFYKDLGIEVRAKKSAGFVVSLTDYWARALSRRVLESTEQLFSGVLQLLTFKNHQAPVPIICAANRQPETAKNESSHKQEKKSKSIVPRVFEFTPFEFGSWDPFLSAFVPLRWLGLRLRNGTADLENGATCFSGYDNAGYICATSSSVFSTLFSYIFRLLVRLETQAEHALLGVLRMFGILRTGTGVYPELAVYEPNPFYEYRLEVADDDALYLVDGGDDGQNIPFHPLVQPARNVLVIFAVDATSELNNFPNGSALRSSAQFFHAAGTPTFSSGTGTRSIFPRVPREHIPGPVFFGCDLKDYPPSNGTIVHGYLPPVIIYSANQDSSNFRNAGVATLSQSSAPFSPNTSTFRTSYTADEVYALTSHGFDVATKGNSSAYGQCVACAILKRLFDRKGKRPPAKCDRCWKQYCWKEQPAV